MIEIEQIDNGFIVNEHGSKRAFLTLEEVFSFLLIAFEGRASTFTGESYGAVQIRRAKGDTGT